MFERFTDAARRSIVDAQDEARRLHHNYIGTEHLFLGLLSVRSVADAVAAAGLPPTDARAAVVEALSPGTETPAEHIPFTPRAKKVLELSLRDAMQLGQSEIKAEHIMLGLLREGEGVAMQVLVRRGVDPQALRAAITRSAVASDPRRRRPGGPSEAAAAEVIPLHAQVAPNCPRCSASLDASAQVVRLTAAEQDGAAHEVLVLACPTCGAVLGTVHG